MAAPNQVLTIQQEKVAKNMLKSGEGDELQERDMRRITTREIALALTLVINFGALVWGAATLSNTTQTLVQSVTKLDHSMNRLLDDLTDIKIDYNARIRVLEDRFNASK